MPVLTVVILTYNEEKHIRRCLNSVSRLRARVCVVDSFSNDETEAIARECGVDFYTNAWVNYSNQFNWALDNCSIETPWTMRLDADEYLDDRLLDSLNAFLEAPGNFNSAVFKRRILFLGRPISHGFSILL